jgi:hypothetical protein
MTPEEIAAIEAEWADQEPGVGAGWFAAQSARLQQIKTVAKSAYADLDATQDAQGYALRGLALATMDEVNLLRQWIVAFKSEVAAASSLADLKARVAALPDLPDRTAAQIKPAIRARIDAES